MKQFETIPPTKTVHILIREAAAIKKRLVEADEYESGLRKTLNFGHTVGHALESAAASRSENLPHGIAVGLGMMVSLHWSAHQAADPGIQRELVDAAHCIKRWLTRAVPAYVQIAVNAADLDALWAFMEMDKKNDTNGVQEVRLTDIGQAEWNQLLSRSAFGTSWSSAHGGV
jgi:3-dehydroquinate synthase